MTNEEILKKDSGAIFSDCRKYRYVLWRRWNSVSLFGDDPMNHIMFIGLNPSTANENDDDPTIRRVIRFAKDWGYNGVYMLNLFAIVSADPKVLQTPGLDLQMNNQHWIDRMYQLSADVLFAWGTFKEAKTRAKEIISMFPYAICLGKNADGSPKHPLYIAANTVPNKFLTP